MVDCISEHVESPKVTNDINSMICLKSGSDSVASANVVVDVLKTKCLPILLYGLEACSLTKT